MLKDSSFVLCCVHLCVCVCVFGVLLLQPFEFALFIFLKDEEAWMAATLPSSPGRCKVLMFSIFWRIYLSCSLGCLSFWDFLIFFSVKVVAVAVFLALGFAFYVFFAPFVGKKMYQYIVMGLYTPLVNSIFNFYLLFFFQCSFCCFCQVGRWNGWDLWLLPFDSCVWFFVLWYFSTIWVIIM